MIVRRAAEVDIDNLAGEQFNFELGGTEKLAMNGTVDRLDIKVSGAGNIDTHQLRARQVKLRIFRGGQHLGPLMTSGPPAGPCAAGGPLPPRALCTLLRHHSP